ncbi:protein of unknown function [Nitratireductor aquimarinus]
MATVSCMQYLPRVIQGRENPPLTSKP